MLQDAKYHLNTFTDLLNSGVGDWAMVAKMIRNYAGILVGYYVQSDDAGEEEEDLEGEFEKPLEDHGNGDSEVSDEEGTMIHIDVFAEKWEDAEEYPADEEATGMEECEEESEVFPLEFGYMNEDELVAFMISTLRMMVGGFDEVKY